MKLVVYGDFNCPFSALASLRVDRLLRAGRAEVEWRAVQHDADIPAEGRPMEGEAKEKLEAEVDEIRGLFESDEHLPIEVMAVRPNTETASRIFSTLEGEEAHFRRRAMFAAVWEEGRNISDASVLGELGSAGPLDPRADAWQREWERAEERVVPLVALPDGGVSGGRDALTRLLDLIHG